MKYFCRICGHSKVTLHDGKILKRIISIIVWQWPMLDFGDESKIKICLSCSRLIKKHHRRDFSRRSDGRQPKYRINLVIWDLAKGCPVSNQFGVPMSYEVAANRRLNGQIRNANEERANEEVSSPATNSIHLVADNADLTSNSAEDVALFSNQRKSSRNRNKAKDDISNLHCKILGNEQNGLVIIDCGKEIGRGIQTTKHFKKTEYVATYSGVLLNKEEANIAEIKYASIYNENKCYTHYIRWNEKDYCYDGTEDDGTFGRLINHSKKKPNIKATREIIDGKPFIYFKAMKPILPGTELRYDYGDRKSDLAWLKY